MNRGIVVATCLVALVVLQACSAPAADDRPVVEVPETATTETRAAPALTSQPSASNGAASSGSWPTEDWQTSPPDEQDVDATLLGEMFAHIEEESIRLHGVIVVRNGVIVAERYFAGYGPEVRHSIHSCTKSFTSALIGIAIDRGYLEGVDQSVLELFPDRVVANGDGRKRRVTLEHLLTMTSGLDWDEWRPFNASNTFTQFVGSGDMVQFVLDRPMVDEPGATWNYNTGSSHLLSAILQRASDASALELAQAYLFGPLGIEEVVWPDDASGVSEGGWGMQMTPRDMAKFGYLYLNKGMWDGQQIVPVEWVEQSTARRVPALFGKDYGYLWWIDTFDGYAAEGYGGQRIYVLPAQKMVVVFTASLGYPDMMTVTEALVSEYIIPAVWSP